MCAWLIEPEHMFYFSWHKHTDDSDYDYDSGVIQLMFGSSVNRTCFNVSINDDDVYEWREVFYVNLTTSDPQVDLSPQYAMVRILDDEGMYYACNNAYMTVLEEELENSI